MKDEQLNERIQHFLDYFELVFHDDWDFTREKIIDRDFIQRNGTFLAPSPGEHFTGGKGDNWGNRTSLLAAYRELKAFAISEGIYKAVDEI